MLRNNLGLIDLEHMSDTDRFVIGAFLEKNRPLLLKNNDTQHITLSNVNYAFSFSETLLFRPRKPGKEGFRYEVIDKKLGMGANGTVYRSRGTLQSQASLAFFKQKPRAVKEFNQPLDAEIEYHYSLLAPHLHAKPLISADSIKFMHSRYSLASYLTEALMPGENLYEIIQDEKYNALRYTTDERIQLTINILVAIQEQAHKIGLIHRDIKPENIMVNRFDVKLIDYRYCKKTEDTSNTPDPAGTLVTSPPEQFACCPVELQKYTLKSDSYALGKTLSELWRAKAEVNSIKTKSRTQTVVTFFEYAQKDTHYRYHKFLTGNLSDQHASQIKNMFEQLSRAKPEDRWTLDQAIACLRNIQFERTYHQSNKKLRSGKQY